MAAVAMVSCCGNSNKKAAEGEAAAAAATTEAAACTECTEKCDSTEACCAEKCDSTKDCAEKAEKVYKGEKTWSDFMKPVERVMFKLSGINPNEEMNWKQFLRRPEALRALRKAGYESVMELHGGEWKEMPIVF